mmetsp:Transcript_37049/g.94702  ORF Transcript_37049/g.94702 Transcript_37049/m.94702 type:complete len:371 (+) Transcript_37049:316-1428(+)
MGLPQLGAHPPLRRVRLGLGGACPGARRGLAGRKVRARDGALLAEGLVLLQAPRVAHVRVAGGPLLARRPVREGGHRPDVRKQVVGVCLEDAAAYEDRGVLRVAQRVLLPQQVHRFAREVVLHVNREAVQVLISDDQAVHAVRHAQREPVLVDVDGGEPAQRVLQVAQRVRARLEVVLHEHVEVREALRRLHQLQHVARLLPRDPAGNVSRIVSRVRLLRLGRGVLVHMRRAVHLHVHARLLRVVVPQRLRLKALAQLLKRGVPRAVRRRRVHHQHAHAPVERVRRLQRQLVQQGLQRPGEVVLPVLARHRRNADRQPPLVVSRAGQPRRRQPTRWRAPWLAELPRVAAPCLGVGMGVPGWQPERGEVLL